MDVAGSTGRPGRLAVVFAAIVLAVSLIAADQSRAGFAPASEQLASAEGLTGVRVGVDPQGNSFVVWQQTTGPSLETVKGRRVSASGAVGPILDLSITGEDSFNPSVALAPNGRAIVAWRQTANSGDPSSAKARWVEPDGSLAPVVTLVNAGPAVSAINLGLVVDPAGTATAAWVNQNDVNKLSARRIGQDSSLSALVPDMSGGGLVTSPVIVALPDGSTLAAWRQTTVKSNVLLPNGTPGTPITLSTSGSAGDPSLAVDSLGNALAAWRRGSGPNWAVIGRRVAPTGAAVGAELTIEPDATPFMDSTVDVAADSANDFLVTWVRQNGSGDEVVSARRLDSAATFAGPGQAIAGGGGVSLGFPEGALVDRGSGIVAWYAQAGSTYTTQARVLDAAGAPVGGAADLIAGASSLSSAATPSGGVVAFASTANPSSIGTAHLSRYLVEPICADSQATVVQGKPTGVPIECTGPGIEGASVVDAAKHGDVSGFGSGAFTYTPVPGFDGTDSFAYAAANDGGASNGARVTIKVGKDTVKPVINSLKFSQTGGSKAASAARKKKKKKRSLSFALRYSEPATARVTVERPARGVRRGKRCRARGKGRGGKRCTYYKKVGTATSKKLTQADAIKLSGKLLRRVSRGGRYRASAIATDAAGNKSNVKRVTIRVKRP